MGTYIKQHSAGRHRRAEPSRRPLRMVVFGTVLAVGGLGGGGQAFADTAAPDATPSGDLLHREKRVSVEDSRRMPQEKTWYQKAFDAIGYFPLLEPTAGVKPAAGDAWAQVNPRTGTPNVHPREWVKAQGGETAKQANSLDLLGNQQLQNLAKEHALELNENPRLAQTDPATQASKQILRPNQIKQGGTGAVAAGETANGDIVTATAGGGTKPAPGRVADAYDKAFDDLGGSKRDGGKAEKWHGSCAEVGCANQAEAANSPLQHVEAVQGRPSSYVENGQRIPLNPGDAKPPCASCEAGLTNLGVAPSPSAETPLEPTVNDAVPQ